MIFTEIKTDNSTSTCGYQVDRNSLAVTHDVWQLNGHWYTSQTTLLSVIRPHWMYAMHEMQILLLTCAVSVLQSVCHMAQRGFTVQKRLNGSRCYLGWTLMGAHGRLGVLIPPQKGRGKWPQNGPQKVELENRYNSVTDHLIWLKFCVLTRTKFPAWLRASKLEPEVELNSVWGAYLRRRSRYLHQL